MDTVKMLQSVVIRSCLKCINIDFETVRENKNEKTVKNMKITILKSVYLKIIILNNPLI